MKLSSVIFPLSSLQGVLLREWRRMTSRRIYLGAAVVLPLFLLFFMATIFGDGQIAGIYPKRGELVAPGTPIMTLVTLDDSYVVFNVREDLMPHFRMGKRFGVSVPALGRDDVPMTVYYISPLGSFATWKSTKEVGSYDMRTFEIRLRPEDRVEGLRPGMTAIIELKDER